MRFFLRSLVENVSVSSEPERSSEPVELSTADPLNARGDRVMPGFFTDPAPSTSTSEPTPTPTPPPPPSSTPPPPPPPPSSPPPPPPPPTSTPPTTITITSISTSLITSPVHVTMNETYRVTETFTRTVPTSANGTLPTPPTQVGPSHASNPDVQRPVSASEVLAIVSGLLNIALLIAMFLLVRRFYRMYRQERVLRKQLQTEGVELK